MSAPPFRRPVLRYPVRTLEGEELLPAGAAVTDDVLAELAGRGRSRREPQQKLLQYGMVFQDLLAFLCEGPYRVVFADCHRFRELIKLMEKVSLPLPLLRSLDYFRAHDPFTYRHILSVFALSTLLARELLPDHGDAVLSATSGPLHDFGKTCIPLSIMRKRTPLTHAERDLVRHHAGAGYVLLVYHFGDPGAPAAKVALEHHERRDGSGYPNGILLDDRMVEIVAVCDVYDALISPRPYRPSCYDNRAALEEMTLLVEEGRLDRDVVQALVACNRQGKPDFRDCSLSLEKRGHSPEGNVYGITAEDPADPAPGRADDAGPSPG
jgi:HD-GYP domain-containing protein (c-di-GMP phosphodiesterase class II)